MTWTYIDFSGSSAFPCTLPCSSSLVRFFQFCTFKTSITVASEGNIPYYMLLSPQSFLWGCRVFFYKLCLAYRPKYSFLVPSEQPPTCPLKKKSCCSSINSPVLYCTTSSFLDSPSWAVGLRSSSKVTMGLLAASLISVLSFFLGPLSLIAKHASFPSQITAGANCVMSYTCCTQHKNRNKSDSAFSHAWKHHIGPTNSP